MCSIHSIPFRCRRRRRSSWREEAATRTINKHAKLCTSLNCAPLHCFTKKTAPATFGLFFSSAPPLASPRRRPPPLLCSAKLKKFNQDEPRRREQKRLAPPNKQLANDCAPQRRRCYVVASRRLERTERRRAPLGVCLLRSWAARDNQENRLEMSAALVRRPTLCQPPPPDSRRARSQTSN